MSIREIAQKNILKRKLYAEQVADNNLDKILKDDEIRILFVACKQLVVEIAKLEVSGKDSTDKRKQYNDNRELIAKILQERGIDKKELRPKYSCDKCKDAGYVNGKDCSCLKKEMSKELIKLSGIELANFPKFTNDFSMFDNPDPIKAIYDKMKKYIKELDKVTMDTVLIMGDTGVGKTHLIGCMTTFALEQNRMLKYSTAFNFNQDMLKYHCARLEEKEDIIDPYLNSEILFIDDLGSENKINNVTNEYLYLIINESMQNHKKTESTTNLDFKQIQDVYGERIFSRLMHKKQSLKINFPGNDLRIKSTSK